MIEVKEHPTTGMRSHATMQNYLEARHNRLANLMDEVPGLSRAVRDMCEGILRLCEDRGIDPKTLHPRTCTTPAGIVFVNLNMPEGKKR